MGMGILEATAKPRGMFGKKKGKLMILPLKATKKRVIYLYKKLRRFGQLTIEIRGGA
jgi:hypothetical protein